MEVQNQMAQAASIATAVHCGACRADNSSNAKFCKGCGHSLYEPCIRCNGPVLLTQKHCGSCGADLQAAVEAKREQHDQWLKDAVVAAKEYEFEKAISLLRRVAQLQDYRFDKSAADADQAVNKVEGLRDQAIESATQAMASAQECFDAGNHAGTLQRLQSVPSILMSDEAKKILAQAKTFVDQVSSLQSELRAAIAKENWPQVGHLTNQMLDLSPDDEQHQRLAHQVTSKLISIAERSLAGGRYSRALTQLSAVPSVGQSEAYRQLRSTVDDAHWLSKQFESEPYATPMLGRLAVRFAKEVPRDQTARILIQQLATRLKQDPRAPRTHLPAGNANSESWMGGKAGLLSLPTTVDFQDQPLINSQPGRFNVAIGLALQGLDRGRISEQFGPKQRRFKSLGRRKAKACWGIDIGTATMKAVCLQEEGGQLVIADCFFEEYDVPLCRTNVDASATSGDKLAIAKFLEDKDIENRPVWANLPALNTIHRFARLPPLKDKSAMNLLDQEISQKIPIAAEELAIVRWIGELGENEVLGRPATIVAAKRRIIQERLKLLDDAGLEISGLQADTVALINFAAHEFAQRLSDEPCEPDDDPGSAENDDPIEDEGYSDDKSPAVAIIDSGASSIKMTITSGEAHWFWTFETGGEDLTNLIARATRTTHADAEQLKRNPAALPHPSQQYELAEQSLDGIRQRLEVAVADALKQNPRFDVVESWCAGGGCCAHQWIRRVMLKKVLLETH